MRIATLPLLASSLGLGLALAACGDDSSGSGGGGGSTSSATSTSATTTSSSTTTSSTSSSTSGSAGAGGEGGGSSGEGGSGGAGTSGVGGSGQGGGASGTGGSGSGQGGGAGVCAATCESFEAPTDDCQNCLLETAQSACQAEGLACLQAGAEKGDSEGCAPCLDYVNGGFAGTLCESNTEILNAVIACVCETCG